MSESGGLPSKRSDLLWRRQLESIINHLPATWLSERTRDKLVKKLFGRAYAHMRKLPTGFRLTYAADYIALLQGNVELCRVPRRLALPSRKGDTCIIVATGPSARQVDWQLIDKSVTLVGVNGAPLVVPESHPLDFFLASDPDFFKHRMAAVKVAIEAGSQCYFTFPGFARISQECPELLSSDRLNLIELVSAVYGKARSTNQSLARTGRQLPYLFPDTPVHDMTRVGWSNHPDAGLFSAKTVVFLAIQMAVWMGFKKIGIVGMDLSESGERAYQEEDARPSTVFNDRERYIDPVLRLAAEVCRGRQVTLVNLSPCSSLPETILPKVNLTTFASSELEGLPNKA